jgi:tetratricopeptide (TPR) repeat protein
LHSCKLVRTDKDVISGTRRFTIMNTLIARIAAAAALSLTLGWACPLMAQENASPGSSQLQIKQPDAGNRLRVEVGGGRGNSVKLVPFPEDLEEGAQPAKASAKSSANQEPARLQVPGGSRASQGVKFADGALGQSGQSSKSVERLPATAITPKSDFRPRFRTPAVKQAQHVEPAAEYPTTEQAAHEEPVQTEEESTVTEQPAAAAQEPARLVSGDAKSLIEAAYAKSKQIQSDADYSEIIDLCKQAREQGLKPSHEQYADSLMSWAYNRRGEAYIEQGREDEALADFESAAQLNPNSWRAIHNRGVSYAGMGRIDEAIADFDRTIELNPRYANAFFNRGELLVGRNQVQEAMSDYQRAIELGPTDAVMHNSLGMAYSRLRQTGDALREFSKAVELEATYAPALVNRGEAYVALGRYGDAAADFRAAIAADPNQPRAYQAAAWLMATCPDGHYRDEKLAIEAANKALELDGENYRNLESLAAAQASAGQYAEAKATQEKAIANVPRDELVAAEKRMALYQKDLAYRETSRQDLIAAKQARQEEAAEKRRFPVQQATAEEPVDAAFDGPENVRYPEDELGHDPSMEQEPVPAPKKRGFLPQQFNPFSRSRQPQQQSQPRNLPKRPNRSRQQAIRPF